MFVRLMYYCAKFNIIKPEQFGFLKGKQTTEAVFNIFDIVTKALDANKHSTVLFRDMSNAFGFVTHDTLLMNLGNSVNLV